MVSAFKGCIIPFERRRVLEFKIKIKDPNWLAGFTAGEGPGCFYVKTSKSKTHKLGTVVQLKFKVTQDLKDIQLMQSLVEFWGCGKIEKRSGTNLCDFVYSHNCLPVWNSYTFLLSSSRSQVW